MEDNGPMVFTLVEVITSEYWDTAPQLHVRHAKFGLHCCKLGQLAWQNVV